MLESGDYITISFQDKERNKKPAGIYWLQAASVSAFSDVNAREIWAYRIPSLIGVVFAAIFTFLAGAKLYDLRTGFLAGLLLSSAPVVAAEATIAKTDGVLLALICLAQLAFVHVYHGVRTNSAQKPWWTATFWLAQGAAILVKGPIGPMISAFTGVGLLLGRPRWSWIGAMKPITGIIILIAIVAPWAFAIWSATEGRFFSDALGGDMLGKVGSVQESHAGPPGYHAALVWLLFWPAAALIGAGMIHIWRDRQQWQARFLLSWIVPGWIVFEIAATKLPHYVMPLYPALAIVAAHAALRDGNMPTLSRRVGAIVYGFIGLVAAGLVAYLPIGLSAAPIAPMCFAVAAIVAVASLLIAAVFYRGNAFTGGVAASGLAALYAWTLMTGILPGLSDLAMSPRLSTALELAERHPLKDGLAPAALAGYSEPSAVFLLGTETILTTGGDAAHQLMNGTASVAIVEDRQRADFDAVIATRRAEMTELTVIDGLNYSNGKKVSLAIIMRERPQP